MNYVNLSFSVLRRYRSLFIICNQLNQGYILKLTSSNLFKIDARSDRTGEVVFKDNFTHAVAGIVEVFLCLSLCSETSHLFPRYKLQIERI